MNVQALRDVDKRLRSLPSGVLQLIPRENTVKSYNHVLVYFG